MLARELQGGFYNVREVRECENGAGSSGSSESSGSSAVGDSRTEGRRLKAELRTTANCQLPLPTAPVAALTS